MLREISRRVDWVLVGGRWTRVSIIGTSLSADVLDRDNKGDADDRVVILMIPGNPGNEGFYADFGQRVVKCLLSREERMGDRKRHYLFYTVSHLNHVVLPNELRNGKHKHYGELLLCVDALVDCFCRCCFLLRLTFRIRLGFFWKKHSLSISFTYL
ncbi:hypothetical protein COOONC_07067 [Cooperia oncophora]